MKKRKKIYSVFSFLLAGTLCLSMAACGGTPTPAEDETTSSAPLSGALPVKALQPKHVDENPYMAKSDANIHHDGYNTDSTDEILPLGIYPEINVSFETTNPNASPAIYFDNYGHAVVPLLGGIAIRDLNATETKTLGYFSPMQHDGGGYVIQSSYTFLDSKNRVVCPTSNNHVLILRTTEEDGSVIPEFEKVLDIDIKAAAETALGKELTQNLLSVVFDYDGNLWFATGGFRIYPERQQQGVLGYIAHTAIESILNGEQTDLSKAVFVYGLPLGEGAENGIAASKDGAVILTNQNCYLLRAEEGVNVVWCTPYESVGAKVSIAGITDSPSLTIIVSKHSLVRYSEMSSAILASSSTIRIFCRFIVVRPQPGRSPSLCLPEFDRLHNYIILPMRCGIKENFRQRQRRKFLLCRSAAACYNKR